MTMGAIHVKVRIVNAYDEMQARRGVIPKDKVRFYEADALVDTGAVMPVIPSHVAQVLGIQTTGSRVVTYADGRREAVGITEPIVFELMTRSATEEALVLGDEVLIGQTILEKTDLFADCTRQRLVPNPAHPDQPVIAVK